MKSQPLGPCPHVGTTSSLSGQAPLHTPSDPIVSWGPAAVGCHPAACGASPPHTPPPTEPRPSRTCLFLHEAGVVAAGATLSEDSAESPGRLDRLPPGSVLHREGTWTQREARGSRPRPTTTLTRHPPLWLPIGERREGPRICGNDLYPTGITQWSRDPCPQIPGTFAILHPSVRQAPPWDPEGPAAQPCPVGGVVTVGPRVGAGLRFMGGRDQF